MEIEGRVVMANSESGSVLVFPKDGPLAGRAYTPDQAQFFEKWTESMWTPEMRRLFEQHAIRFKSFVWMFCFEGHWYFEPAGPNDGSWHISDPNILLDLQSQALRGEL